MQITLGIAWYVMSMSTHETKQRLASCIHTLHLKNKPDTTTVMQDVGCNEHGSLPGHQPGVDIWHVAQVSGIHKDHATAGDGGWRGILQVTHLQVELIT